MSLGARLRSLASDAAVYGVANIAARFLTFLLNPLYTNVLDPASYGPVRTLYSYVALGAVLYAFGLESAYLRFAATGEGRDGGPQDPRAVFSTPVLFLAAAGLLLSVALSLAAVPVAAALGLGGHASDLRLAAWILFLDTLSTLPLAYLRVIRKPRAYALVRIVSIAANVAFVLFLLLGWGRGASGILEANLLSSALTVLLLLPVFERLLRPRLDPVLLRELLRFSLPLVPSGLAALMVQVVDRPILQLLTSDAEVGVYTANYTLGIAMMLVVGVFQYAWQPFFLARARDEDARALFARVLTYYLAVAFAVFLAVTLFVDRIVTADLGGGRSLLGRRYWEGLPVVPWVLLGYVALGVYTNLTAGPTLEKRTGFFPWVTGAAAATNVTGNLLLIPRYGYIAAAWTTLAAYVVMALGMGLVARKVYPVDYEWARLARLTAAGLGLWGAFAALGGTSLGLGARALLLAAYPVLVLASGFLDRGEAQALRRRLGR